MFSEGKLYKSTNMRTIVVGITHIYELQWYHNWYHYEYTDK